MKITKRQLRRIIKEELSFDNAAYEYGRHDARMVAAGEGDIDWERFDNDRSYAAGVDFEQEEQDRTLSWQGDRMPFDEAAIVTRRQLRRIIREAIDPRMKGDPEAYWREPRAGKVERSKIIYDKLRKGEDLHPLTWVHDTGKEDQDDDSAYDEGDEVEIVGEAAATGPTREDRLARLASDILRHYDTIASDVGEIHVDDLIDHWVGQGNPDPGPEIRTELIRQNYGEEYLR